MQTSESVTNILKARVEAKKQLNKPKKEGTNPHFKSKYITYEALIKSIEEAMLPHGLDMFVQLLNHENGAVGCQLTLYHTSGEWIKTEPFYLPSTQSTAQGYGSASTYVQRYCISAFWGIAADEDDDGQEASTKSNVTSIKKNIQPVKKDHFDQDRFDIINTIRECFLINNVTEKDQQDWLKKKYNVLALEKLEKAQLLDIKSKLYTTIKGTNFESPIEDF